MTLPAWKGVHVENIPVQVARFFGCRGKRHDGSGDFSLCERERFAGFGNDHVGKLCATLLDAMGDAAQAGGALMGCVFAGVAKGLLRGCERRFDGRNISERYLGEDFTRSGIENVLRGARLLPPATDPQARVFQVHDEIPLAKLEAQSSKPKINFEVKLRNLADAQRQNFPFNWINVK